MAIPLLFHAGGAAVERYGVLTRRSTPRWHGGEEARETFTRGSAGHHVNRDGYVKKAATNVYRIEYVDLDGDGVRETPGLLLERSQANKVPPRIDSWANIGTPVVTTQNGMDNTDIPSGGVNRDSIGDDDGAVAEGKRYTLVGGGGLDFSANEYGALLVIKKGTSPPPTESDFQIWNPIPASLSLDVRITWSGSVPTASIGSGAGSIIGSANGEALGNGFYLLRFRTTLDATHAGGDIDVEIHPAGFFSAADQGNIYVGGVALYDTATPGSFFASQATRSADRCEISFPHAPQAMTVYVKFVERAVPNWVSLGGKEPRIIEIGNAADAQPWTGLYKPAGVDTYAMDHAGATSSLDLSPAFGDLIELRGVLNADGSAQIHGTKNGGAESSGNISVVVALADEWSSPPLASLGCIGANGQGDILLLDCRIAPGVRTLAEMQQADVY